MTTELAKTYDPKSVEQPVYDLWQQHGAFDADPAAASADGAARPPYCIVIPPPNVTAPLHLGHALNNTLQDVLIRWRRMQQFNTLWMPGTDHAGIATQTIVEKRILAQEGRRRTDFERAEFVGRIQAWKDEYEARILAQLRTMGCSCDWRRTRFTMDETCAAAVRETFFKLFADGLIYRGKRLVNWDPATQTVLADDEVEHESVAGHFYYLRYPLVEPVAVPCDAGVSPACPEGVPPSAADVPDEKYIEKSQGRYLPHWTRAGGAYAITFRLDDAMPRHVLENWKFEREDIIARAKQQQRELTAREEYELHKLYSERVESFLDAGAGECLLKKPEIAQIVADALKHFDQERYELLAWCVMPNHVHVVVHPLAGHELKDILHSWKSFTAKKINAMLGRTGTLWRDEYYDHLIRDEEDFNHAVNYVAQNPGKIGLQNWPFIGREHPRGRDALETRGQDALETRGQDARDTRGRDARVTLITHVTVATTRPETMLGDTAVAMNPRDPRAKALVGQRVRLPIVGRIIPIIADEHVVLPDPESADEKARFSTGFLKVTPAHDTNDYEIGRRHEQAIAAVVAPADYTGPTTPYVQINVLAPDGTISHKHGWTDWQTIQNPDAEALIGLDRFEARKAIVEWFRTEKLLENVREYTHEVGHSYRSHVPIEPYLSDQWYVAVKRGAGVPPACPEGVPPSASAVEDGSTSSRDQAHGTHNAGETPAPRDSLAGLALAPLLDGRLKFTPDRYANNYRNWLENLRDWPISRQLWWGHQIPVWTRALWTIDGLSEVKTLLDGLDGLEQFVPDALAYHTDDAKGLLYICVAPGHTDLEKKLEDMGFVRDSDVLDTWFSSALWPFSTLGWPKDTPELNTYYPGHVLCTAREIITLWVSRMVMMGQYCVGDIPFSDVFIHAMIQDGEGRKMSKSLGNGIDPLDIIDSHGADAMRFTLVSMTTQTQDVRMPVKKMTLPDGREVNSSEKFDMGRNFCNKLWNASRFAMMNLAGYPAWEDIRPTEHLADAWILSRLNATVRDVTRALETFAFNEIADTLYHFAWDDFCDWYLEIAKSRIHAGQTAPKAVVAHVLDLLLRLLHPMTPFITEEIWQKLNAIAPVRGPGTQPAAPLLVRAPWPASDAAAIRPAAEQDFAALQEIIRNVRNVRTQYNVPPGRKLDVIIHATGPARRRVEDNQALIAALANLGDVRYDEQPPASADAATVSVGDVKLFVLGIVDRQAERTRLEKQRQTLQSGIRSIEGKLGNEGFLKKAPPDVVEREKIRLDALRAELAGVEKSLAD